jgi:hypothetical protein
MSFPATVPRVRPSHAFLVLLVGVLVLVIDVLSAPSKSDAQEHTASAFPLATTNDINADHDAIDQRRHMLGIGLGTDVAADEVEIGELDDNGDHDDEDGCAHDDDDEDHHL